MGQLFKVVVTGSPKVGKTQLVASLTGKPFCEEHNPTRTSDFEVTRILLKQVIGGKFVLWDTCSDKTWKSFAKRAYGTMDVIVLVYSVADRQSFKEIDPFLYGSKYAAKDPATVILVGNQVDIPSASRQVTTEEGKTLAAKHQVLFEEVSAKSGFGMEDLRRTLHKLRYETVVRWMKSIHST